MSEISERPTKGETGGSELFPVLPLRDIVVFPHMIVPAVRRAREIGQRARRGDAARTSTSCSAAQKNASEDDPDEDGIYRIGTLASVLQLLKLPDGTVKVLVEGTSRARGSTVVHRRTKSTTRRDSSNASTRRRSRGGDRGAHARSAGAQFEQYVKLNKKISLKCSERSRRSKTRYESSPTPSPAHLAIKIADKQEILETDHDDGRAAGARLRPDGERDLRSPG